MNYELRIMRKCLFLLTAATAFVAVAGDNEYWTKGEVSAALGHGFKLGVEEELRFDAHRLYDEETTFFLGYTVCPYLSVQGGYRLVRERSKHLGPFRTEHRPLADIIVTAPEFWTLKFDYRSRFEWRDKQHDLGYFRLRERLRLRTSWSVTDFKISPYGSLEAFLSNKPHSHSSDSFDRLRSQVGVSFKPVPSIPELGMNAYYMVQHGVSSKSEDWEPTNVFGLEFSYMF